MGKKKKPSTRTREILVTGATGFIGSRVALALAGKGHSLRFLCRPQSVRKLDPLLAQLSNDVPRPRILEGDLDRRDLGIKPGVRRELGETIGSVFHLAAGYHLGMKEAQAMATNVEGTRRMLDLAQDLPLLRRFHYVSTMAVAGNWQGTFREEDLDVGQEFEHAYGRSKFLAESHVQALASRLPVTVYRPGVVVGDSRTGEINKVDGPYYVFRMLHRLRRLPGSARMPMIVPREEKTYFHLAPVDFVVNAMIALADLPTSRGKTYHLMDPAPPSYREFYLATLSALGFHGTRIARPVARLVRLLRTRPLWGPTRMACSAMGLPAQLLHHYLYKTTYDTSHATKDLAASGIHCPRFDDYLPNLISYFENNLT